MRYKDKKLYEQIYDDLFGRIKSGELKGGDRLPTEHELMRAYGVSRITAMNAVNLLAEQGLVERVRRRGTFVRVSRARGLTTPLILPYNEFINYEIITGAQEYGMGVECAVPFYNSRNNPATEREILQKFVAAPPDGLLIYPCSTFENIDLINDLYAKKVPIVFMDREILGTDCPVVTSNNAKAVFDLVTALVRRGYKKFGYYGVHGSMTSTERDRFNGFCMALAVRKIPLCPDYIFRIPPSLSERYRYAEECDDDMQAAADDILCRLDEAGTDAPHIVCCANDYSALNLLRAAVNRGWDLPKRLGITGFDNLHAAETSAPRLTTIGQNFYEIGRTALNTLLTIINGGKVSRRIRVDTNLIFRDSTY